MDIVDISRLDEEQLWTRAVELAKGEHDATCDLVEALAELDRRGLPHKKDYASLFEACVHRLKLTEGAAYRRIRAARAIILFPPISVLLRQRRLSLEAITLLHPYLKDADAAVLVQSAADKRIWEIERIVAARRTEEPRRDVVRMIAPQLAPTAATEIEPALFAAAPAQRSPTAAAEHSVSQPSPPPPSPRSPEPNAHAVRIAFTADADFHRLLRETQAAMRHKYPDGRLDGVFRDALRALLRKIRPWAYRKSAPILKERD